MWWLFVLLGPFALIPLILWGAYLLFLWVFGWMIILIFEVVPKILVWAWRAAMGRLQERARLRRERQEEEARLRRERQEEEALWEHWREMAARRKSRDRSHRI